MTGPRGCGTTSHRPAVKPGLNRSVRVCTGLGFQGLGVSDAVTADQIARLHCIEWRLSIRDDPPGEPAATPPTTPPATTLEAVLRRGEQYLVAAELNGGDPDLVDAACQFAAWGRVLVQNITTEETDQ